MYFSAEKEDLPEIWEELVDAGFESGHAYGKALRTVKSCVGSSWCRYGVGMIYFLYIGDAVGLAIELENRYKGIRSPHKIKGGVSGCVRECAEAQGKDFGLIATDKGWNLYICGNGGSKPKHAILLIGDVVEVDAIKYLDRFLMYYILTADRLMRTARWLEKLDGGIEYVKKVVIDDALGICSDLELQMNELVGTYKWYFNFKPQRMD
jgi:nitrite reductase (NAD(P)H)